MKTYDVKCPLCGHLNHDLFLEETDGWMECENCKQVTQPLSPMPVVRIPVFTLKDLDRMAAVKN